MFDSPSQFMQWSLAVFLLLIEVSLIALIWIGSWGAPDGRGINLDKLVSEADGNASFSRFQFLIFTFVVASAYVVQAFLSAKAGGSLPTIPGEVLGLIGISGGSYILAKGIESNSHPAADAPVTADPGGRWVRH